jgi:hypothetical protein
MGLGVTIEKKLGTSPGEGGPQAHTTAGAPEPGPRVRAGLHLCVSYQPFPIFMNFQVQDD